MATQHRMDGVRLIELTPSHCPNGHPLGPGHVLVGTHPCLCAGLVHRIWRCVRCDTVQTWPPCRDHPEWLAWAGEQDQFPPASTPKRDRQDSTDSTHTAERTPPTQANEPMENADPAEPIEPTDSTEPTEPTDNTEPRDPIDKTESLLAIDRTDLPRGVRTGSR